MSSVSIEWEIHSSIQWTILSVPKKEKFIALANKWVEGENLIHLYNESFQYILKGEQPRYSFSPCIPDYNGIHWYFSIVGLSSINDKRIEKNYWEVSN